MPIATIDGLRIHFEQFDAEPEERRRVLFVHGTGCNASLWLPTMEHLAAAGHSSVAIDLPGHGESEGLGFRGVADYASFVGRLADALGWASYSVAGHSLGGGVALAVALYHSKPLDGLILVDTGARLRVHPAILRNAYAAAAGEERDAPSNPQLGYAETTQPAVIDEIAALRAHESADVTYRDWIADDSCDFMSRLRDIRVPAIAICGAEDGLTPVKYHEHFRDHLPNCSLEVIPDAGHWPYFEQPTAFRAALLGFLDG